MSLIKIIKTSKLLFRLNKRSFSQLSSTFIKPNIDVSQSNKLFINGNFCDSLSNETIDIIDPRNEEIITKVSCGNEQDIDIATQTANKALQGPWSTMGSKERMKILNKLADLIEQNAVNIGTIEAWDCGKPINVAIGEVYGGAANLRYFATFADKLYGNTVPCDNLGPNKILSYTLKEPLGVIGTILPWNGPFILFCVHMGISLACGNTLVAKVAETSPLSALYCATLFEDAGLPKGVVNIIPGYGEIAGQALCKSQYVNKISFTGETTTGKLVMQAASENLTPVTLELGGKSPCIIFDDCDMNTAINTTQNGLFYNSGQVCCASTRIYCHEKIYDEFVEKTINAVKKRKIGDNFDKTVDQGPQQNKEVFEKVLNYIDRGTNQDGADLLIGGKRFGNKGYFVESTVFGNVKDDMDICKNEIFGPSMQILKFNNIDDVLYRANDTKYGLAAGVISQNIDVINRCARELKAGTIWVNTWNAFNTNSPFGGYKQSGFGRVFGVDSINSFTQTKSVTQALPHCGGYY